MQLYKGCKYTVLISALVQLILSSIQRFVPSSRVTNVSPG